MPTAVCVLLQKTAEDGPFPTVEVDKHLLTDHVRVLEEDNHLLTGCVVGLTKCVHWNRKHGQGQAIMVGGLWT